MKTRVKDLAVILGTAALTALAVTLLLAPGVTMAGDDPQTTTLAGAPGSLVTGDLTLTVEAGEKVQTPGAKPVLVLTAVSASKKTTKARVDVEMTSMTIPSFVSRAPSIPVPVWTKSIEVEVGPGKSRTIEIATDFETKPGTVVGVHLSSGETKVRVAGFGVKKPAAAQKEP